MNTIWIVVSYQWMLRWLLYKSKCKYMKFSIPDAPARVKTVNETYGDYIVAQLNEMPTDVQKRKRTAIQAILDDSVSIFRRISVGYESFCNNNPIKKEEKIFCWGGGWRTPHTRIWGRFIPVLHIMWYHIVRGTFNKASRKTYRDFTLRVKAACSIGRYEVCKESPLSFF